MKRILFYTAVILSTLTFLYILWQFNLILLLFVLSLFVAASIRPLVDRLTTRGLSKAAALLLVYIVAIGGFLLLLLLVGDPLLQELNLSMNRGVIEYEALYRRWEEGGGFRESMLPMLPAPFNLATADDTEIEQMLPVFISVTRGLAGVIGGILLVLAVSIYWSVDQDRFERLLLSLMPAQRRIYARDSWREIQSAVGDYLRSQIVQSVLAALFLGIGAALLGFPYPLLLAFGGALAAFVPLFGGILTTVWAFGLGTLEGFGLAWAVAAYALIVFLALELFVEPRLWRRERHDFLLTILVIVVMVQAFGFWGLVTAPPLAAAIDVLIRQGFRVSIARRDSTVQLEELEQRYERLKGKVGQSENGDVTPELQNLMTKLADLLAQAKAATS